MTSTSVTTYDLLAELDGLKRWEKAKEIVRNLVIRKVPRTTKWQLWKVQSQSKTNKFYSVIQKETNEYVCDCPDFEVRGKVCKHLLSVLLFEITR
jgi:SWIM zinc finger